ncbi:hypothetical protein METBIDRAFT_12834 [Metschnikowia bicuspidata var. bicuspidata NRRL YB-4993]|uniref:Uncharacterized protein n=1 Tax=Metschnikowia bicuspidata var. bicuspidata NRRL YB-4993 TaxID=869754 RepID=A0A1A0H6R9_9ASCO|nr:hypothetical protein METBIDRAFT_12834 [Metschnikowia bicuspidata var. bicuspidata NRRL YB-4993]OBA19789.1 hypothetical protein METBIDRAFT_12834 [Metschnikowia bicuspidata var. bicuspidata NRRL YB-4993]
MFEDSLIPQSRRKTGRRKARLLRIIEEDVFEKVALAVEKTGQWDFSRADRADVLRRVRIMYRARTYPQATFEDWHSVSEDETGDDEDERALAFRDQLALGETAADFDAFVIQKIVHDLKQDGFSGSHGSQEKPGAGPTKEAVDPHDNLLDRISSNTEASESDSSSSVSSDSDSETDTSDSGQSDREISDQDLAHHDSKARHSLKKRPVSSSDDHSTDSTDEEDDSMKPDLVFARKKLKQWANEEDTERSWLRDQYSLHKSGYELYDDLEVTAHDSARRQHALSLKTILHLKILEKDWHTAFKTFSLLSKLSFVDLRSLWPLGIEILSQLRDESRTNKQTSDSRGRQEQMKIQQFYDWMTLAFPMYGKPLVSFFLTQGPVFRTGSKTYTPIYRVAGLWNLLSEKQYSSLRDKLNEIMLVPPYTEDGVFCYMLLLCCLSENADLLSVFEDFDKKLDEILDGASVIGDLASDMSLLASKESIKTRVFRNIAEASNLMEKCDSHNFNYPRCLVEKVIERTRAVLSGLIANLVEDDNVSVTQISLGYTLHNGKVELTKANDTVLPRKYWDRIIIEDNQSGAKHWVGNFFHLFKPNKVVCLVCGQLQELRRRANLKDHLSTHNITLKNQAEEKAVLEDRDMTEMVRLQEQQRTEPAKVVKKKPVHKKKVSLPTTFSNPVNSNERSLPSNTIPMTKDILLPVKDDSRIHTQSAETLAFDWNAGNSLTTNTRIIDNLKSFKPEQSENPIIAKTAETAIHQSDSYEGHIMKHQEDSQVWRDASNDRNTKSSTADSSGCDTSGEYLVNRIDDSLDGQIIAKKRNTGASFDGFSPDTTQENQTFTQDLSRDISRDFHQFATQTQESQRNSELPSSRKRNYKENDQNEWPGEFSMDLYQADSSINFTRIISESFLGNEGKLNDHKDEQVLLVNETVLDAINRDAELRIESDSP